MRNPVPLSEALQASLNYIREKKRQEDQRKKMTQAIVRHTPASSQPGNEWLAMRDQAKTLVDSGFLPRAINTPEKALAVMQTGKELGLGPMQALRSIHIIEGKPTMSADLIAALVHSRLPGALLRVKASTDLLCSIDAARPGQEPTEFTFTMEDAKKAGLTGKDNWRKYPRAMLRARCITEAARAVFADCVLGLYDPDELGAVTTATGEIVSVTENLGYSPHVGPGESENDQGDADTFRHLCGVLVQIETDLEKCDSWDKCNALRGLLGTRAAQSQLTRTMQQKAEAGDISPSQRAELGKTWMRCNRKLEKLEEKLKPSIEATFTDEPDGTEALGGGREPGDGSEDDSL